MDFKVAGTREGITALQMDIKVTNVTAAIMQEALEQARRGRLFILDKMDAVLEEPRKAHLAVRSAHLHHDHSDGQDSRTDRTGRQGDPRHHRATGVKIDVEDDGTVNIFASDGDRPTVPSRW